MKRVLVTGSSGFIGRPAVAALEARGFEVVTVGRRQGTRQGGRHVVIDLLSTARFTPLLDEVKPDAILHLAWTVEHGRFWTAPDNLDWVAATLRLARAAAAAGTSRFVGTGTCMEYDWSFEPGRPRRETDPLAGSQLYSEAKIATFRLLERFFAGGPTTFAWGRVFHPFGQGEPEAKLFPSIARAMRAGETMTIRSGPFVRDFIAAEDVGEALAGVVAADAEGPVNIATGEAVTVAEAATMIQGLSGGRGHLDMPEPTASAEPQCMSADVSRLRNELAVAAPPPLSTRLEDWLAGSSPVA